METRANLISDEWMRSLRGRLDGHSFKIRHPRMVILDGGTMMTKTGV